MWSRLELVLLALVLGLGSVPTMTEGSQRHLKVIGGAEAQPHAFPYLVGIASQEPPGRRGWCGGALIGREFVLTTAHCLKGVEQATLYIGVNDVRNASQSGIALEVRQRHMLLHAEWSPRFVLHDIALIHLPKPVEFDATIQPISLPSQNSSHLETGALLIASGWGRTSRNASEPRPATVHAVELRVMPDEACERYHYFDTALNICLEGSAERTTCRGDSGGPLVHRDPSSGLQTLVGLTSYGRKCDSPTVLTRVSQYLDWIAARLISPKINKLRTRYNIIYNSRQELKTKTAITQEIKNRMQKNQTQIRLNEEHSI